MCCCIIAQSCVFRNPKLSLRYCERPVDDSGKTCRDIGSLRAYRKRQKQDPAVSAYNRAYKTHYARIKYKTMTREEFQVQ